MIANFFGPFVEDDQTSRRKRNVVRGVVYGGMASVLAAGIIFANYLEGERKRLDDEKWNHAPNYTTDVRTGESLSDYIVFEGEKDINRYVALVRMLNPGKVGNGPKAEIKEGDTLVLPDISRDGYVGSRFVKITVPKGFTLGGYCKDMAALSGMYEGDCIYGVIAANRGNNDALGRPIVERTDLVRAEYSNGVPAEIKVPRVQMKNK
ncbi:MAG: hypothetical protein HYW22_01785 [Candidatus Aenigmarchaeota archaeon]|nr:hypothetical protein [Candidatus Aenigmarchaeota archaeon]